MDGEDVFGCKIRVQLAGRASSGPPGSGSPALSSGRPRKARRDRAAAAIEPCSTSQDSGVKLSSSDDSNDAATAEQPAVRAPAADLPQPHDSPAPGDDIVVCGPVEEIDVDMETPTKDVSTCVNAGDMSTASDPQPALCGRKSIPPNDNFDSSRRQRKLLDRAGRGKSTFWPLWAAAIAGPPTFEPRFHRAMLCIRGTSHGPVSVCHKSGVLLKRLNVGSHKQHHTIAQGV